MPYVAYNTAVHQFDPAPAGAVNEDCTHLSAWSQGTGGNFLGAFAIDTDPAPLTLGERLEIPAGRIRFLAVESLADQVAGIRLTNIGAGYDSTPTVTIAAPTNGTRATAVAVLDGGEVDYIQITNPGSGYNTAPGVTFTGGTPTTTAVGTALLSIAGTARMSERVVRGMISGGVWVQAHTDAPGTAGTGNPVTGIDRIEIEQGEFTVAVIT